MKVKFLFALLAGCFLFLAPLSLCAQEPVCGKCLKKKSNCPYRCNHPTCKICGRVCGAKSNPCPYGGKHPKCNVCGKLKENCAYKGKHPTCSTCGRVCGASTNACPHNGKHPTCNVCGQLKENCAYRGVHPQCTTCGKVCGALSDACPYDGNHPKCSACGQVKANCVYQGNHPQCTTCGKLCGASSNACPYDGKHPKCNVCGQLKENCAHQGNHPQCATCGKVCGASSNACPYDGRHPNPSVVSEGRNKVYTIKSVSFKMIAVAGGVFTMGATSEQRKPFDDEKPTHTVTLSDYYIGETEVTQELWAAVMGNNPSHFTGNMQRPVEKVSWDDCQTFIRKLNELTGANFRLPTEAEWEFAARGGRSSRGYQYSGSSNLGDVAWYGSNSSNTTHPVKMKSPNELGIYDMSGNVWEWCSDWFGSYSSSSQTNPKGPSTGSDRVCRGGSWYFNARCCRSATRGSYAPGIRGGDLGLRLAY